MNRMQILRRSSRIVTVCACLGVLLGTVTVLYAKGHPAGYVSAVGTWVGKAQVERFTMRRGAALEPQGNEKFTVTIGPGVGHGGVSDVTVTLRYGDVGFVGYGKAGSDGFWVDCPRNDSEVSRLSATARYDTKGMKIEGIGIVEGSDVAEQFRYVARRTTPVK